MSVYLLNWRHGVVEKSLIKSALQIPFLLPIIAVDGVRSDYSTTSKKISQALFELSVLVRLGETGIESVGTGNR